MSNPDADPSEYAASDGAAEDAADDVGISFAEVAAEAPDESVRHEHEALDEALELAPGDAPTGDAESVDAPESWDDAPVPSIGSMLIGEPLPEAPDVIHD